mmetsp:Transcript_36796/g.66708  ORF Transcript_36796/g.66708 Transcript_36796/m.66708 type:complete len:874 (+) Transcript_36796:2-2623(+)
MNSPRDSSPTGLAASLQHANTSVLPSTTTTSGGLPSTSRRNNAWHDVLEICKKGFANKMSSMGQEILADVRSVVQKNSDDLRKDVESMLESRERNNNVKLDELLGSMSKVQHFAASGFVDFSQLDLSPVVEEIKGNEASTSKSLQAISQRLLEDMTMIGENLEKLSVRSNSEEERLKRLMDKAQESEKKLAQVLEVQSSLLTTAATIASEVQKANMKEEQEAPKMRSQIEFIAKSFEKPLDINAKDVVREVRDLAVVDNQNCNVVLSEIGKIQQALHLDFVQMLTTQAAKADLEQQPALVPPLPSSLPQIMDTPAAALETQPSMGKQETLATRRSQQQDLDDESFAVAGYFQRKSIVDRPRGVTVRKRVREFWTQTETFEGSEKMTQTDPKMTEKKKAKLLQSKTKPMQDQTKKPAFSDADAMKQRARAALMKPQYNVFDEYYETGWAQEVAKSMVFEYFTLSVVVINALWLSIDADNNDAHLITDADAGFVVVENIFCTYFFFEVVIRFCAFKTKLNAFYDYWFLFDFALVSLMVLETWFVPIVVLGFGVSFRGANVSFLRLFRLIKILRLSRMAKVLRAIPELVIIVKGIGFASRSVVVFFALWMLIIYVFSLLFRQLSVDHSIGPEYFSSVYHGMNTLLLYGILPDHAKIVLDMGSDSWYFWPLIVFFILLTSLTIMYMLVGVLVDVVGVIAATEKEGMTVAFLSSQMREKMELFNYSTEGAVNQFEFQKMLWEPEITKILQGIGVDVVTLVDMLGILYEDICKDGREGLEFEEIIDLILNMRGANPATVKDVKEQLRVTKSMLNSQNKLVMDKLSAEFDKIHVEMKQLRDEAVKRDAEYGEDTEEEQEADGVEGRASWPALEQIQGLAS